MNCDKTIRKLNKVICDKFPSNQDDARSIVTIHSIEFSFNFVTIHGAYWTFCYNSRPYLDFLAIYDFA